MRSDDGHIINKCLNDEPEAFGFLVDKYKACIYAFAYTKLRNFHDAEDVTQEVFIKAFKELRNLRRWDSFITWLYSITTNLCNMRLRSQSRRPDNKFIEDKNSGELDKASMDSYHQDKAENSIHESLDCLDKALNSLPEIYNQVLSLHYLGGMSTEQIAKCVGVSPTAIRQRLTRARAELREGILAMMNETFDNQRLQASFTFRIVEAVKNIRVQPIIQMKGVPWGLSLATGLFLTIMSFNPHLISFDLFDTLTGAPLSGETRVLKLGEIPVDILKISNSAIISSEQGKGNGVKPENSDQQNTFFLAPKEEGGQWTKRASMPVGKQFVSCSAVNGKFYAIGGWGGFAESFSRVEEYDPITDTWTQKADMPTGRSCSTCVVNDKIYAIGGINSSTVEEYDPATDTWTKKADMPIARWVLSTASMNGKIYAFGGAKEAVGVPTLPAKFISTVDEYDPVTDTWTKKGDMPKAIGASGIAVVKDKIYIIGGGDDNAERVFSSVWEYDPVTDKWTSKSDMPTPRCYLTAAVVNDRIYAIGGANRQFVFFSTVEEYDPATDTWTIKTDMPMARATLSADTINGKIYVAGGATAALFDSLPTMEEYDPGIVQNTKSIDANGKKKVTWGNLKN